MLQLTHMIAFNIGITIR